MLDITAWWLCVQGLAPQEAVLSAAGQLAELLVWLGHEADAVVLQRALGEWLEAYAVGEAAAATAESHHPGAGPGMHACTALLPPSHASSLPPCG